MCWCIVQAVESPNPNDIREMVDGPFVVTLTAHLPFLLGIPDHLGHTMFLHMSYVDPADTARYGENVAINIRVFTITTRGLPLWSPGTHEALKRFYGFELEGDPNARYGEESLTAHEQWVTLETPCAPAGDEDPAVDPAFAFHRCLHAFNAFLRGVLTATKDIRIRPVTTRDFRPVVVVGAIPRDRKWRLLTTMLMHEGITDPLPLGGQPITQEELNGGIHAVLTDQPYLTTILWRTRAQRALRQTGDAADAIISFQIAAESLLFDTYRMLLIDEGLSAVELQSELDREAPFKSLVVTMLPAKLGGQWDITRERTAIGEFWRDLYLVRNSIIHRGFHPHGGHAEAAQTAYWKLRDHVEERLVARCSRYPRAVFARLGKEGLERRGAFTNRMKRFWEMAEKEPSPWYWPYDRAGRDRNG